MPPGDDIPLQGTHPGDGPDDPLTSSVRAQQPPDPTPRAERVADDADEASHGDSSEDASESPGDLGEYRLSRDPASGRYRMSLHPPAEESESPGGGFREISRHSSPQEMSDALDGELPDGPRFVVLEDTETGAVRMGRGNELDNWPAGGYDQATVFESEDEAAAYLEKQRGNA
ncbi:MAG: hypothetical protein BRD48_01785 [Bacteroidetes bacterium QS_9_68_14]|nr:MAG: hypothetical protein BRD48_01785 [Bacteroidetes bacterium QS_9_68_14]